MSETYKTSIVFNEPNKIIGLPKFYYRCRSCDYSNTNTPQNLYQTQKRIQNTVRVESSLYAANLAPFNAYKKPTSKTQNVCWNQMSDRPEPSYQPNTVPTGFYHSTVNNKRHSVTSSRPGGQNPGGFGVDIKHNSYDRYLNRIKGKGPLRRQKVPDILYSSDIVFNCAKPIYGAKVMKTSIITGCNCDDESNTLV